MLIDQTDAFDSNGDNLVRNEDCECNYVFSDDWSHWVLTWINGAQVKAGLEDESWLGGGPNPSNKAPNRALDQVSCWVNNPRDMIWIQNQIGGTDGLGTTNKLLSRIGMTGDNHKIPIPSGATGDGMRSPQI
jgi:hypothetical protein